VLAAIEARDEDGAAQAMGDHIRVVGEVALARQSPE
jgi:DNA-binding GntR family transcriptional regulator